MIGRTEADFIDKIAINKGENFALAYWLVKSHVSTSTNSLDGNQIGTMLEETLNKIDNLRPESEKSEYQGG